MSDTPWTPGPWEVLTQGKGVSIVHEEAHPERTGGHRIARMHSGKRNIHADARLIAAAPKLARKADSLVCFIEGDSLLACDTDLMALVDDLSAALRAAGHPDYQEAE